MWLIADKCRQHSLAGTSWQPGAATQLWQHHALAALDAELRCRFGAAAGIIYR